MPWKQWSFLEQVSSAQFQSYLQNQTLNTFTTSAQRDAQITAPANGQACYLTTTGELLIRTGTTWAKPWNLPWGHVLGPNAFTPNVSTPAGATTVGGSGFTLPVLGRRYAVHASAVVYQSTYTNISQTVTMTVQVGAVFPDIQTHGGGGAGFGDTHSFSLLGVVTAAVGTTVGVVTINPAGITADLQRGFVWVEDIGPGVSTPVLLREGEEEEAQPKESER